ncbi:MAG: response regulator [Polyangiaceae bacterium]
MNILLVEDNPADVELSREVLDDSPHPVELSVAPDGAAALEYLRERLDSGRLPDLILLDLNMPRLDGRGMLQRLKAEPRLKRIPVVVFTSSSATHDVVASYELGASCYVVKPVGFEEFQQAIRSVEDFWLTVVKLPPAQA